MNQLRKFKVVTDEPPVVIAMSRSMVINGKVIFCWRKLSKTQRQRVDDVCTPGLLDTAHLDRVLEARTLDSHAQRRAK
jgi:hypothetical protein